jgi:glutathione S-transferase
LIPDGFEDRIETLRLHALANGLIDALILWRNERDRPEQARSGPHLDAYAFKVGATLDHLEAIEVSRLDGRSFDLGHITLGTALGYADFRFGDLGWRSTRPILTAWFEEFSARPSARATAPVE